MNIIENKKDTEEKTVNDPAIVDKFADDVVADETLAKTIVEKRDVFQLLDAMGAYLKAHVNDSDADKKTADIMELLDRSAYEPLNRASKAIKAPNDLRYYVCTGQDANWLLVYSELCFRFRSINKYSASGVIRFCDEIRTEFHEGTPGDMAHVAEIMESLEARYGYLSKVMGPDGLHVVSFPTITSAYKNNHYESYATYYATDCLMQIVANDPEDSYRLDLMTYHSVAETLMENVGMYDTLPENALRLLERTRNPSIRSLDFETQRQYLCDSLVMALSYHAPYGDFPEYRSFPDDTVRAWQDYAARMIDDPYSEWAKR